MYQDEEKSMSRDKLNRSVDGKKIESLYKQNKYRQHRMDELKKELEHLGLSDKEARVYLAALEMGPSPVQDISHKAHVNRATTYVMIESLAARGLMSTFQKGKKRIEFNSCCIP